MRIGIDDFDKFKVFFNSIYEISDSIELQVFKDHLSCSVLDKGHTRFMTVEYKKEFFSEYEVEDVESVVISAEDLHIIIQTVRKIKEVVLETNENYLICKLYSENGNSRIFEFVLSADYVESVPAPQIDLPVTVNVELEDLYQGVRDLQVINSGEMRITVQGDNMLLSAGFESSTNYNSIIQLDSHFEEKYSSKFTLDYIKQLTDFNKIDKSVELNLGNDVPLIYTIKDNLENVKVKGMIAPRIEVED